MNSALVVTANRPMKGLIAFVPAFAMTAAKRSFGGSANALHLALPASFQRLDRHEEQVHPGEGSA